MTELRLYVPPDTVHFGDVIPSQSLGLVLKNLTTTSVFGDSRISTRHPTRGPCARPCPGCPVCIYVCMYVYIMETRRFIRFWASGGAKFHKMGDSLPWMPMNRRALSSAEKSATVHISNQQTKLQTVYDISTPCLSASVDNQNNKSKHASTRKYTTT